ncbi:hypothetical protein T484DRAFT_1820803 [Baffinella frigidus]|nr:hypothetical protein T484DRAFT_1820803 [Cryptophyta sp. CCMP2293]
MGGGAYGPLQDITPAQWDKIMDDITPAQWDKIMDTNVKATFFLTKEIIPIMREV